MDDSNTKGIKRFNPLIPIGIGLAVLFWVLDAVIDVSIFHEGDISTQLFHPEPYELWIRLLVTGLILIFTGYVSVTTRRLRRANTELAGNLADREESMIALNESKIKYHSLVEQIPAAVYIWELGDGGACLYISPQIEQMLGFSVAEWLADPQLFFRQVHPDDRALAIAAEEHTQATGQPLHSEFRMIARDGRIVWVRDQSAVLPNKAGQPRFNQGILIDITKSKETEDALQIANENLTSSMAQLEQFMQEIVLLNEMGNLLQTCRTMEEAYPVISQSVRELFPNKTGALYIINDSKNIVELVAAWGESIFAGTQHAFTPDDCWALWHGQLRIVENGDTNLLCQHLGHLTSTAYMCMPMVAQNTAFGVLHLRNPLGFLLPRWDESQLRLAQRASDSIALALMNLKLREALRQQSIRDPLTGLFNRRYLEETLQREVRRAARNQRPVGIIMIDIDHFKHINDTFGHTAGDVLLSEIGSFLRSNVRGEDIACRFGGEEFVLIMPEATREITSQRAEHFRKNLKQLSVKQSDQLVGRITLSLGVAIFPDHGSTGEEVLQAADVALYRAKRQGRDRVVIAE